MPTHAKNSKAFYDYDIKETYVAGLVLTGPEVKSVKQGNVSMNGSYVTISQNSISLINCHIGPYKYAPSATYDPTHTRSLLLNKREVNELIGKDKGMTIIPLEIFEGPRGRLKLKIAVAKARKKVDKREYLKKKDEKRELRKNF